MRKGLVFMALSLLSEVLLSAVPREPRYPVILAGFKDKGFTLEQPREKIQDMLCKRGFNYDNATGSVLDYYEYNSNGAFCPSFDVFGPVTLPGRMQDYGKDVYRQGERVGDTAPEKAVLDACRLADEEIDFSRYDADGDGLVDLVLVIYAGHDQAAGAAADALWAQQWDVQRSDKQEITDALLDGVRLGQYIITPELGGASGQKLSGIGPVCHELGHFLGLPDFYDVDSAKGGNAGGLYGFSLMGAGLYNNEGHTPPTLNALEMNMLGWLPDLSAAQLPEGSVVLQTVHEGGVYVSGTATEGEFFLYEYRNAKGWDAPLPEGLVIYRVDRSERMVGDHTAAWLWSDWRSCNRVNALAAHPCFHIVPASQPELLAFDATLAAGRMVYPGLDQILFYEPVDWSGDFTDVQVTQIGLEEGAAHFRVQKNAGANINGCVRDLSGKPLPGVLVTLKELSMQCSTGEDGVFFLPLPGGTETLYTLSAIKDGYAPVSAEVSLGGRRMVSVALELPGKDDARERTLSRYDKSAQMGYYQAVAVLGGVRFGPEELYPYVGQVLTEISFYPYLQPAFGGEIYVVVDMDGERVLTRKVENLVKGPYFKQVVDISDAHIVVPEGREMYIGYGSPSEDAHFRIGTVYPGGQGNSFYSPFSAQQSRWKEMYVDALGIYMDVALSATVTEQVNAASLTELGYAYIEPVLGTLKAGDRFPLVVHTPSGVTSVKWTMDGTVVSGESVLLGSRGTHSVRARLTYRDGREEVLELLLKVN